MRQEPEDEVTRIMQQRVDPADTWSCMKDRIASKTKWNDEDEVFVYVESLDACSLERCSFAEVDEPSTPFEGRIFDAKVEARWRLMQGGSWAAWIIREDMDLPESEPARRITCRYYLRGIRDEDKHDTFHEARYPNVRFRYPVDSTAPQDRAYVEVAEYWRIEPEWDDCTNDEAARKLLTEPLLFAHRFIGVGAGSDQDQSSEVGSHE